MKKNLFIALLIGIALMQAHSQNLSSGLSGPVVIDTKCPQVTVITPNGGESVGLDGTLQIEWTGIDDHLGAWPVMIGFSTSPGGEIYWLETLFANSGSVDLAPPQVDTEFAKVHLKITDTFGNEGYDASDNYFTIFGCEPLYADAGPDTLLCPGNTYFNSSAWAVNHDTLEWYTPNGQGFFDNPSDINTTYFPSGEDYESGCIYLILRAYQTGNCSFSVLDTMQLCFIPAPTAYAGPDTTICLNSPFHLYGEATNAGSVYWTSFGDGYLDALMNTYTPGPYDIAAGMVTLKFTAMPFSPCILVAEDDMILYLVSPPVVEAGNNGIICEFDSYLVTGMAENYASLLWSTNGDGYFDYPDIASCTYIPGPEDKNSSAVMLTLTAYPNDPCSDPVTDNLVLEIRQMPFADAGSDNTTCGDEGYQLAGIAFNFVEVLWTTSGDGSFDNPNIRNPVYTPGIYDLDIGYVDLSIMATGMSPCAPAGDQMRLFIQSMPSVNAGPDEIVICQNNIIQLVGIVSNESYFYWYSSGDGEFLNIYDLETEYIPGEMDIQNGYVFITLQAENDAPCWGNVSDQIFVFIQHEPTVFAGNDAIVPGNGTYLLSEAFAENCSTYSWETSGDGIFSLPFEALSYTPGASDLVNGTVVLTLVGIPYLPCDGPPVTDDIVLYYTDLVTSVSASQRTDGSKLVDITYDLNIQDPVLNITAGISLDGGDTFQVLSALSGDVGADVLPGQFKHIIWDAGMDLPGVSSDNAIFRITAGLEEPNWECGQTLTDTRDGKVYNTVQIGNQCWMKENLNIGTRIAGSSNQTNNGTIEKYCYDNDENNCTAYGGLYQWDEMMQYSLTPGIQGICPAGWHLPTDAEWCTLTTFLDVNVNCASETWNGVDAGGKMKETGYIHWLSPNVGATNSSGFTGLPGGARNTGGWYGSLTDRGHFWSSTSYLSTLAFIRALDFNGQQVGRGASPKTDGFSIRCIKM